MFPMLISGKIAKLFKFPGFVCIDYLIQNKIYVPPSIILNILTRDWRRWVRPVGFDKIQKVKDILDPTFGYTTVGTAVNHGMHNAIRGSWFTCPESGTADSITYYGDFDPSYSAKCAIYKKSDGSFVAGTEERTNMSGTGWQTFNYTTSPTLENIDYWLVGWGEGPLTLTPKMTMVGDSQSGKGGVEVVTYNSWPSTYDPDILDNIYSIYCTYTAVAPPPVGVFPARNCRGRGGDTRFRIGFRRHLKLKKA